MPAKPPRSLPRRAGCCKDTPQGGQKGHAAAGQGVIVGNGVRGGSSQVKITDVAAAAGVAPMTVSRVINTPDRVSPETTARVRAAIEKLGYVPNLIAGGLSSRRSRMVAAIVPTIAHPMFAGMVQLIAAGDKRDERDDVVEDPAAPF